MSLRRSNRNVVLMNAVSVDTTGAQEFTAFMPPHNLNPRFQASISNFAGSGSASIMIEHSEISGVWTPLSADFIVTAEGTINIRTEDLTTRFPFTNVRANVTRVDSGVSFTVSLVGVCDHP